MRGAKHFCSLICQDGKRADSPRIKALFVRKLSDLSETESDR